MDTLSSLWHFNSNELCHFRGKVQNQKKADILPCNNILRKSSKIKEMIRDDKIRFASLKNAAGRYIYIVLQCAIIIYGHNFV